MLEFAKLTFMAKDKGLMDRMRRLRVAMGFTGDRQKDFAIWLGVTFKRWNNIEGGQSPISLGMAKIIRRKVGPGITYDWLIEGRTDGLSSDMLIRLGELPGARPREGQESHQNEGKRH